MPSGLTMPPARSLSTVEVFETGVTIALLTGLTHAAYVLVDRYLLNHVVFVGREFVWMAPLAYTVVFLIAGLPLLVVQSLAPRLRDPRIAVGWFALLGVFGLLLNFPKIGRASSLVLAIGVAFRLAQTANDHLDWWKGGVRRLSRRLVSGVCLLAAGQLAMRSLRETFVVAGLPMADPAAPNVLIIILDTVRAEALSLYGFRLETTPALRRLASEGVVFDWAIAPAPWTLPSHASMFSGQTAGLLGANWTVPLDDSTPVLAEAFRRRGYRTAGFVANLDYTAWDSGLGRGFARYDDYGISLAQLWWCSSYAQTRTAKLLIRSRRLADALGAILSGDLSIDPKHHEEPRRANEVTGDFLAWQAGVAGRPFFAFLNYFDAHAGYFHPPGSPVLGRSGTSLAEYLSAIRWLDANVATVLGTLRARGVLDNTIVVVTADHGELFDEHGLSGHAHNLYRNVLHVPLYIRYPAKAPMAVRLTRQVSMQRLAATLADLAGLAGEAFPGTSLRDAWEHPGAAGPPVLAEVRRAPNIERVYPTATGDLAALLDDSLHYIVSTSGREELFRYRVDTAEAKDLAGPSGDRDRLLKMRQGLREVRRKAGRCDPRVAGAEPSRVACGRER